MLYFNRRPVVANMIMFGIMFVAVMCWDIIGKEELPEHQLNFLRISISYPGAAAENVESFISKPVEEELKGITSLKSVNVTSSFGSASIRVEFEPHVLNLSEKVQEVKDAVDSVSFPSDVENPSYRQFKNSEKAIIDLGIYLDGVSLLDIEKRQLLQSYVLSIKNRLLSLPEVSGVDESGYLAPELQVQVYPEQLKKYELTLANVKEQITAQNVRQPVGNMKDKQESEVAVNAPLETLDALEKVILTSGFEGQNLRLKEIAKIKHGFSTPSSITKIQGNEGVKLSIKKSTNVDIITAQKSIIKFVNDFNEINKDKAIRIIPSDDESYDIRNRLSLIFENGLLGFILIVLVLFLFLDFKSGLWVGMGIPFSLSITLILATLAGYTLNNMTLAAIIIVLGIVVDDAIIVAENIQRKMQKGGGEKEALEAVGDVGAPVIASLLTTCAAFIPLFFFSGIFGLFVKVIPAIIFFMLFASLFESFLILPGHMIHPLWGQEFLKSRFKFSFAETRERLTHKLENWYEKQLAFLLHHRKFVISFFMLALIGSGLLASSQMRYVMFPREESRNFRLKVVGEKGLNKYEMAEKLLEVEKIFLEDDRGIVLNISSDVAQNRRGGEVLDNEASIRVEITPASERDLSFKQLMAGWQKQFDQLEGFEKIELQQFRFGSSSGSPIAIEVQENNDKVRAEVLASLKKKMSELGPLVNVEVEKPIVKNEYQFKLKAEEAASLGVSLSDIGSALRTYIQGDILYTINSGDEEVDLRFSTVDSNIKEIDKLLDLSVSNSAGYLLPIRNVVEVNKREKASSIKRVSFKRAAMIYADLKPEAMTTPLEVASLVEDKIFPEIYRDYPTVNMVWREEVENSRESAGDFQLAGGLVVGLIYLLLVILFNSLVTPLLIASILPFGLMGVIYMFWVHGILQFGFFSVIGALGMLGVVINDSIVLVNKFEEDFSGDQLRERESILSKIANLSATRLRAIIITTFTTVVGLFPTAYGVGGYDSMLSEMMLAMAWGLLFGMFVTLVFVPVLYSYYYQARLKLQELGQ